MSTAKAKIARGATTVSENFVAKHVEKTGAWVNTLDISKAYVSGRKLDQDILSGVQTCTIERSISAPTAVTVEIHDADHTLQNTVLPKNAGEVVVLNLNDRKFELVKISGQGASVTLTFEDQIVAWMRRYRTPRKASNAKVTRAQFIYSMMLEVREDIIPFYCPELNKHQPTVGAASKNVPGKKTLDVKSGLRIKKTRATSAQIRLLNEMLDAAAKYSKKNRDAMICCVMCVIVESDVSNSGDMDDLDSVGMFQQRKSMGWKGDLLSIDRQVKNFLIDAPTVPLMKSLKKRAGRSLGALVQATQVSAYPNRYNEVAAEAKAIVDAYGVGSGAGEASARLAFSRGQPGKPEDTWMAATRLAEEVNWRLFTDLGVAFFIDEIELSFASNATIISQKDPGIEVEYDIDWGKPVSTATVTAVDPKWLLAPGLTVVLDSCGMADGVWIVETITKEFGTISETLKLRRAAPPKKEPVGKTSVKGETTAGNSKAAKALAESKIISDQRRPYTWGGGHGALSTIGNHEGLDCSGSVSLALKRAGLFGGSTGIVSGQFASSWGKPGRGKEMTVWANAEHVWIEFQVKGEGYARFDTSPHGDGERGPRVRKSRRSTAGFTPRHASGV
ncbi:MAG: hypothetical protein JHC87_04610 [Thermoleophilaceae bacterium]|nr:hypothetical protein [Thermoleophilaceae bacterium]